MNTQENKLEVGAGGNVRGYSDVQAVRVVEVSKDGKTVKVQNDKATLMNGVNSGEPDAMTFTAGGFCGHFEGQQRWLLEEDKTASVRTFTLRKNGKYVQKGFAMKQGSVLSLVHRHYHDFNF